MNRQGPGGQTVRGMPGFPSQQGQPARATSRGAGSQPSWGFGMQNGNAQSMGASQARPGGPSTFAQSLGGGQPQGALDLSDFPSLGGASQSQFPSSGQAVWSNQRPGLQTSIQRGQQAPGSGHPSNEPGQQSLEDAFFSGNGGNDGLDDYRHGGQGGLGQLSSTGQTQPDEFPPLGRRPHGDIGQDRRMNLMQNAATAGFASPFPSQSGSRVPSGSTRQGQDGAASGLQNGGNEAGTGNTTQGGSMNGTQNTSDSPIEMSDQDKYGIRGLLENVRSGDPNNLAIGIDLTNLGLDLNSSEPLYPTFGGPFAVRPARPLRPDFTLPSCYNVGNVHPLEQKIPSFQEETLFWMFYNLVKHVGQELAAVELTSRQWRYHKVLRVWITKDQQAYGEPQQLTNDVERGRYIVFNNELWRRESREMIIRYADLDDHITPTIGPSIQS